MTNQLTERDMELLRETFAMAEEAKSHNVHPFASLVADKDGKIICKTVNNSRIPAGDPTQHAELLAAAQAAKKLSREELAQCTLYTSAEPCCMCAGAIYWCGIGRVVYGLAETSLLAITGAHPENPTLSLPCRKVFAAGSHKVEVEGPLLEDEAARPHKGFWV